MGGNGDLNGSHSGLRGCGSCSNTITAPRLGFFYLLYLFVGLLIGTTAAGEDIDFNRDIRPILSENCLHCHGQDENHRMADLRLDQSLAAIESGAIIPGDGASSEMIIRIFSNDTDLQMPPSHSHRSLTDSDRELLKRWIDQGAHYDPHWAFVAPQRPPVPQVSHDGWVQNPIDAFVIQKMQTIGLNPSPAADRQTLIRRLYADLIGLPPTVAEVEAFIQDDNPDAYLHLVDRLLSSPHYGERMALGWLDAARYADSNGFQQDGDTWQWIWRDWVVQALNSDMPFDQFSIWQLAGDLLDNPTQEQLIATAFNRNHLLNGEGGAIAEEQRFVILFDRMETTTTNWLGLTVACAQCHSHKYDPISHDEYYQLFDMFNRVPETGVPEYTTARLRLAAPYVAIPSPDQQHQLDTWNEQLALAKEKGDHAVQIAFNAWKLGVLSNPEYVPQGLSDESKLILAKPSENHSEAEQASIDQELKKLFEVGVRPELAKSHPELLNPTNLQKQIDDFRKSEIPQVMVMSDDRQRVTQVLNRGQYLDPLNEVSFDVPRFLPPLPDEFPRNRLGFAKWLFLPENPLVARVQVNRIWQHFFGSGLVKTAEDFGIQSEYPLHRELLDWLAVEFRENGWSVKQLQRLILTSATYQQSSRISKDQWEIDAENRYYSRANRFRMPAMVLRDWALGASGLLVADIGGKPVYPYQPAAVWESLAITKERDFTYPHSEGSDLFRRSLYTFWRRTISPANMFDASNRQVCRVRSGQSNTPLHALTTLNDPTWVEAARVLAERCLEDEAELNEQLQLAFQRILGRVPDQVEQGQLLQMWQRQLDHYQQNPASANELLAVGSTAYSQQFDPIVLAATTNLCLAIFNLDEALNRN